MEMSLIAELQSRFLETANPESVYSWLKNKENAILLSWPFDHCSFEKMLLDRNEPLIDLGLALFGPNIETGILLYNREDVILQKALLTRDYHSFSKFESILSDLLSSKNIEYLAILFCNTIDRKLLVSLFKKEELFKHLTEDYWLELIKCTKYNKILKYPYDAWKTLHDDSARDLYNAIYNLFDKLTVSDENAELIVSLVEHLPNGNQGMYIDFKPMDLIQK